VAVTEGEFGKGKPTEAQATGYAQRKIAETMAKAQMAVAGIDAGSSVLRELISCAKANPIIGVLLAAVTTDILGQAQVIRPSTEAFMFRCLGVAFGVSVSVEAAEGLASFLDAIDPFKSGGPTPPNPADLIAPTPTTLVENPEPAKSAPPVPPPGALGLTALIPRAVAAA